MLRFLVAVALLATAVHAGPRWTPAELRAAIERTLVAGGEAELALFFDPAFIREAKRGRRLAGLHWKDADWERAIAASEAHPENLWLNGDEIVVTELGLSLYRGAIFANGYFARTALGRPDGAASLVRAQPWLRLDAAARRFVVERTGAQDQLLVRLTEGGRTLRLYRGLTRSFDLALLEVVRALAAPRSAAHRAVLAARVRRAVGDWSRAREGALSATSRAALERLGAELASSPAPDLAQRLAAALTDANRAARRDALFMTPGLDKARAFGRHGVIALDLPADDLTDLSRGGEVYIGIEGDAEIAFVSPRAQAFVMMRWTAVR